MGRDNDLVVQTTYAYYPNIAAIDLGTNSCRILIATVSVPHLFRNFFKMRLGKEPPMRIIDSFARVVGLGEGLKQTGVLSKVSIERTLESLEICKKKMETHAVSKVRAVATEACRQADNTEVLLERVKNELGLVLNVISPQEEAQLVLKGCMGVLSERYPYAILLDIGGGSTEFIWLRLWKSKTPGQPHMSVIDSMSLPYGVVTLKDSYVQGQQAQTFVAAQTAISESVHFFMLKNGIQTHLNKNNVQIVTSSGTVTTLAFLVLGLDAYDRSRIDGFDFYSKDLQRMGNNILSQYLNKCSSSLLKTQQNILSSRVMPNVTDFQTISESTFHVRTGMLAAGTVILNAILERIGPHNLRIADRGVREGLLYDLIEEVREEHQNPFS
ncbi:exopolyphosphatase [Alphaproteobacteria bacterium]|nr:exopolyphosphatase [Alphaproteobacteria bacterium]